MPRPATLALLAATACCLHSPGRAEVTRKVLRLPADGPSLLREDAWRPWKQGFRREGKLFVCDNGGDAKAHRGAGQTVVLNQKTPRPIIATACVVFEPGEAHKSKTISPSFGLKTIIGNMLEIS